MPCHAPGQIMEELDTKTLLAMSRTCSTFRSLLHSDQGAAAWKCARANTGEIPDLQAKDLEEWMLASLLFDSTCHVRQPFLPPRQATKLRPVRLLRATDLPQRSCSDGRLRPPCPRLCELHAQEQCPSRKHEGRGALPSQSLGMRPRVQM